MTKELSKQLCELCGVEPKKDCNKYNLQPCEIDCSICYYAELIYPDLVKPNNFMKLLELKIDKKETIFSIITECNKVYNIGDFLWLLKGHINNDSRGIIKQAIKNTEWEY